MNGRSIEKTCNWKQVNNELNLGIKNREKTKKLQTFDLVYFNGKRYFDDDGSWNYFQPVFKYFKIFSGTIDNIFGWKSEGLSENSITIRATSDNSFDPKLTYIHYSEIAVKFEGNCLKQDKVSFSQRNAVNPFVVYELDIWPHDLNTIFTLK